MKIELTRNTIVGGEPHDAGWTADVSRAEGRLLVGMNKAVGMEAEAERAEAMAGVIATAVPGGKRSRK